MSRAGARRAGGVPSPHAGLKVTHSHSRTHSLSQARMNGLLTVAGPLGVLWGGKRPVLEKARGWSRGRRQLGWIQLGCCVEAPGPGGKVWGARLGRKRGFVFLIVS